MTTVPATTDPTTQALLRIGILIPSTGETVTRHHVPDMAVRIEEAGYDSLWVADHIVMTRTWDRSHYPFSADGQFTWDPEVDYLDSLTVLSMAAAVTSRVELGTAVLVLPLRHPVALAKQIATIDHVTGGRIALGIGVGWYVEEMEALGVDPTTRGRAFDESVELLRGLWAGDPDAFDGQVHSLPAGVIHRPIPKRRIPLLVGGVSDVAVRRAATQGDGWLGLTSAHDINIPRMAAFIRKLRAAAETAGRSAAEMRVTLRIIQSSGRAESVAAAIDDLIDIGVHEIVVDADWSVDGAPEKMLEVLRSNAS